MSSLLDPTAELLRLNAVALVGRPLGGSQSAAVVADDGRSYVVKHPANPQGRRVLANELLASLIGQALGVPVAVPAIVRLSPEFVESNDMTSRHRGGLVPWTAGECFGSQMPMDGYAAYGYISDVGMAGVANLSDMAGVLAFDKWLCNCDGRQVIYYGGPGGAALRVMAIDHGYCFDACDWDFPDSPMRGVYARPHVYDGVTDIESFEPWLSRIEQFDPALLQRIGRAVPPEWYGEPNEMATLLDAVLSRRSLVRSLVHNTVTARREWFPAWETVRAAACA